MRQLLSALAVLSVCIGAMLCAEDASSARPPENCAGAFDEAHRFIFFAVLEGAYEDGLTNGDVDQIMKSDDKGMRENFVYGCPICHPVIHALEAYKSRPKEFSGMKGTCSNFGSGLDEALHAKLYSVKPEERLGAVNALMQSWTKRRMSQLNWTPEHMAALKADLENKRKQGMNGLENMTKNAEWKLHYAHLLKAGACPSCNGALGLGMPEVKPDGPKDHF